MCFLRLFFIFSSFSDCLIMLSKQMGLAKILGKIDNLLMRELAKKCVYL